MARFKTAFIGVIPPMKKWGLAEYLYLLSLWAMLSIPCYLLGWGWASIFPVPLLVLAIFGATYLLKMGHAKEISWGGDNIKLAVTDMGIAYTDFHNKVSEISWNEIHTVWWQPEPIEQGFSNWIVFGCGKSIEIDENSANKQKLPHWFAEKLPGFDPNIVRKAIEHNYFKTDKFKALICWTRNEID